MAGNIRFSVIMPTYNRKHCICDAIDSVLSQTFQDFELIVVDDGSDDGTCRMIQNLYQDELKSKKLRYVNFAQHMGVCFARNEGLKQAKYDWIAYCDTDNIWDKSFLYEFAVGIKENPNKKCFYAKLKKKSTGKIFGVPEFDRNKLFLGNYIDLGVFVHERSLYLKYGGFDENLKRLVDFDLILTYTKHEQPIFIDKCVLLYNDMNDFPRISSAEDFDKASKIIMKKHRIRKQHGKKVGKMSLLRLKKHLGLISAEEYERFYIRDLIKSSQLFDEKWYLTKYPEVAQTKKDPIEHYLEQGWKDGYNPSQKFDNDAYLQSYPDVAAAQTCPLLHYINHGRNEGRYVKTLSGEELLFPKKYGTSFIEKLSNILDYPIKVREDYENLKSEMKSMQK